MLNEDQVSAGDEVMIDYIAITGVQPCFTTPCRDRIKERHLFLFLELQSLWRRDLGVVVLFFDCDTSNRFRTGN
jgi:hypothetical protein